ncbi:hypothetical protein [Chitinophaga arvensicola]|uniref:TerB family tellurite resistance protein n=1 Tax=Chitinophaga arvensicola TaxID=29529 RepID=A0A1I0PNF9_9BACT|nr:hypothetical protein [Chitinophaga arvensicola]SEW15886.1 hypothetical protein SAMN04488122_0882 [Chitinophaga arvensicola]
MKAKIISVLLLCSLLFADRVSAQSFEIQQLILNVEKLNQFREVLDKMYDGYKIISEGYQKVKDVTSGNYKIHDLFLDGLYQISPEIKKYHRVPEIIEGQIRLAKQCRSGLKYFRDAGTFKADDIIYVSRVYSRVIDESLQNLDELLLVITARKLRMSDDERLTAIDRIADDMNSKLAFTHSFSTDMSGLVLSRTKEKSELQTLKNLHGIK